MTKTEKEKYQQIRDECGNDEEAGWLYTRWKALTDLFFLGETVFGWGKSVEGKRRRVDPKFHKWLAGVFERDGDKLILVPRKHVKTTWAKLRIVQRTLQNPNKRIGYFSESPTLVKQVAVDLRYMFEKLRPLFPDMIPDPGPKFQNWEKVTENELTIKRFPEQGFVPQGPQIQAIGAGARITGTHVDEAFCDDIIAPHTVTTEEQMRKSREWWAYLQSIIEVGAPITMTGTFYHYNDLYNEIIREKHFAKGEVFIRKAIENGKPIYSSWFTLKDLEKIKLRSGPYIWNCQYMLNPVPQEDQLFPPPQPVFMQLPKVPYTYYVLVDPAPTVKQWSDKTAIVVAAVDKLKDVWFIEALGYKKPGNEIADLIIRKAIQYKAAKVGIEFGTMEYLRHIIEARKSELEVAGGKKIPLNIVPIPISRKMSKGDRINLTLGSFVRQGKVHIHDSCRELIRQMDSFTGKQGDEDDVIDAASMVFAVVDGFAHNHWLDPRGTESFLAIKNFCRRKPETGWRSNFVA